MLMIEYLTHNSIHGFIFFESVILLVILSNIIIRHQARKHSPPGDFPLVSLLVPVRNEAESIGRCVQSLLAQDYPSFEVLVLDDQSADDTRAILEQIATSHPKLRLLDGVPPPEGWLGKNWACAQLANQAQGEVLFFTDADTVHRPQSLRALVSTLLGEKADMLSGFPGQEMHTWLERFLVPFFSWAVLCFIPLGLAYRLRQPFLSAAVGQVMLFRRQAYQVIGGHAGVRSSIVDDLSLSRQVVASRLRWRVITAADLITCRMYRSGDEAIAGFAKNLFAAFGYRLLPFLFVYLWLGFLFWQPLLLVGWMLLGGAPSPGAAELFLCLGLALLMWLIPYLELRAPVYLSFLYPLTILVIDVVALKSLLLGLCGRLTWKGRVIPMPKWKWV
jgi:chlorobactene glucosyltransferase